MESPASTQCVQTDCKGSVVDGTCQSCGASAAPFGDLDAVKSSSARGAARLQKVSASLKALKQPMESERSTDDLLRASEELKTIVPDNYDAWRAQADLWLAAVHQLETRQIQSDDSVMLMGVPLVEDKLRDSAEEALRQCAHFAPTVETRVSLIDEANKVRRVTWF
jgi:hypothetical protein